MVRRVSCDSIGALEDFHEHHTGDKTADVRPKRHTAPFGANARDPADELQEGPI